eukprot:6174674-Pleurochrysis_carterae.AAC.5
MAPAQQRLVVTLNFNDLSQHRQGPACYHAAAMLFNGLCGYSLVAPLAEHQWFCGCSVRLVPGCWRVGRLRDRLKTADTSAPAAPRRAAPRREFWLPYFAIRVNSHLVVARTAKNCMCKPDLQHARSGVACVARLQESQRLGTLRSVPDYWSSRNRSGPPDHVCDYG